VTARRRSTLSCAALALVALYLPALVVAQTAEQVFDPSRLHEVRLFINSRDLETLRSTYLENTFYPADLQVDDTTIRNAGVRSRGGGSRSPTKPGLLVDFDRYVGGQTFAGRRAIVLDNQWQDPSMIRERVAMALFSRMGLPASLESMCRLYINNEYAGVYAIVEDVDKALLERTIGEANGNLYEYHWLFAYYFNDLGRDLGAYAPLFEPRTRETESVESLYAPIRELARAVSEPNDTLWRQGVERYLDLSQLVTFVAVETFLAERDGLTGYAGVNNFYLYRPAASTRHIVIPWDRDNAFQGVEESIFARANEHPLVRTALAYPDLYTQYLDVLDRTARAAAANGWLENEVRAASNLVMAAAAEDTRAPYPPEANAEAVAHLLDFARRRPQLVLEQVAAAR
jgi:spore coat protein CotH